MHTPDDSESLEAYAKFQELKGKRAFYLSPSFVQAVNDMLEPCLERNNVTKAYGTTG